MKINMFALGRAVRVLIVTSIVFSVVGFLLCPELVQFTPEDPDLLSHQRGFALACISIGFFAGCLTYWDALRDRL
jgi:hypothetical protein